MLLLDRTTYLPCKQLGSARRPIAFHVLDRDGDTFFANICSRAQNGEGADMSM